jgi:hypothetical protein
VAVLAIVAVPAGAVTFRLGAQVFGSHSSLTGDLPDEGSWEGRFGVGGGIVAELVISPAVALSFQPAYAPRGGQQNFYDRGRLVESIDYKLDYISLPLLVRVTGEPVGVRGFVTAGLDIGILTDATITTEDGSSDISDGFDDTTIGPVFGAGAMVPVKRHFLTFEVRYSQGLGDIMNRDGDSADTGIESPSVKYRGFGLLVGFLFTLGGGE